MNKLLLLLLLCFSFQIKAQLAADFTVTDTEGKTHNLFADYLNQGKVVVIKIFFVNCPPCNAIAKTMQQKYEDWGAGNGNVQFIELTNKLADKDPFVKQYKNMHGITFPSISTDGNALNAIIPYTNGTYGPFSGTPTLIVLAPNKTVMYDVLLNNLDAVIEMMGGQTADPPNQVTLNIGGASFNSSSGVSIWLKSRTDATKSYDITALTNGTHSFQYPSETIPEMHQPFFELLSTANSHHNSITVIDLVAIRNHILGTTLLSEDWQKIAADVTGDGKLNVTDLVAIQKSILGLETQFPNHVPSYKMIPTLAFLEVPENGGGNISIDVRIVKMGNVK